MKKWYNDVSIYLGNCETFRRCNLLRLEYLGHSCFLINSNNTSLLFDPFLSNNPKATKQPEDIKPTHIFVSHAHDDHLGDTVKIAKVSGAKVYATFEIAQMLEKNRIKVIPGNIGGSYLTEFGNMKFFNAIHSSGISGGIACGFIVEIKGKKIYYAGDTALFSDMKFLRDENIYLAFLPIGDVFTMGVKDAIKAVEMINPKIAIPMHYNTFPAIESDPQKFKEIVESRTMTKVIPMFPGQSRIL